MGYVRSMRFFISKFSFSFLLFLGLFFLAQSSFANSDLAVSKVKDNCDIRDSIEGYHCLGYLVEQGFNQQKFAKEQIEFDPVTPGDVFVIKLTKPLVFQGAQDKDCDGDHPLCGDAIAFTMHGHGASQSIVLDTTAIQDDRCAIRIKAPQDLYMIFTDFRTNSIE